MSCEQCDIIYKTPKQEFGFSANIEGSRTIAGDPNLTPGLIRQDAVRQLREANLRFVPDDEVRSSADIQLRIPGSNRTIALSEVADVKDTHREERLFVRLNGEPSMQLSITKLPDANTLAVIEGVKSELNRLERRAYRWGMKSQLKLLM